MQTEMELSMEPMMVESKAKKVSKSLTMNEKRSMYSILSFLVIVNRDGLLDDSKTQELMEHLPIFKTISEKKEFLSQEMFDMKMIEKDILKPMVLEHNAKKKQEKKEEKKKGKSKVEGVSDSVEKKKRVSKKKVKVEEASVEVSEAVTSTSSSVEKKQRVSKKKAKVEEASVEVSESVTSVDEKKKVSKKKVKVEEAPEGVSEAKKRGRKAKQQIVECNTEVNVNAGNSQEDQLADLVNQLTGSGMPVLKLQHPVAVPDPEEIDLADLEEVLSNMEEGGKEESGRVVTPRLPEVEGEGEGEVEIGKKGKESKKKVAAKSKTSKK